jgi:hypothetical protein
MGIGAGILLQISKSKNGSPQGSADEMRTGKLDERQI